jgi:hypothetical protein
MLVIVGEGLSRGVPWPRLPSGDVMTQSWWRRRHTATMSGGSLWVACHVPVCNIWYVPKDSLNAAIMSHTSYSNYPTVRLHVDQCLSLRPSDLEAIVPIKPYYIHYWNIGSQATKSFLATCWFSGCNRHVIKDPPTICSLVFDHIESISIFGGQSTISWRYIPISAWLVCWIIAYLVQWFSHLFPFWKMGNSISIYGHDKIPECIPPCSMFLSYRTIHGYSYIGSYKGSISLSLCIHMLPCPHVGIV